MIPKRIITIWLSNRKEFPVLIERCINSQKIEGYEHKIITLENCYRGSKYVNEALAMAEKTGEVKWFVKASDWLRVYHIWDEGGIYLDADMEVLPNKNFDDLLDNRMFTENEVYGMPANAGFGAEKGHSFLKRYLDRIEENFKGDGDLVFEPGVRAFADLIWIADKEKEGIKIYNTELFFPYKHGTKEINITPDTRVFHHYANTWCDNNLSKLGTDYEFKKVF
jgi:hypothetical protein